MASGALTSAPCRVHWNQCQQGESRANGINAFRMLAPLDAVAHAAPPCSCSGRPQCVARITCLRARASRSHGCVCARVMLLLSAVTCCPNACVQLGSLTGNPSLTCIVCGRVSPHRSSYVAAIYAHPPIIGANHPTRHANGHKGTKRRRTLPPPPSFISASPRPTDRPTRPCVY